LSPVYITNIILGVIPKQTNESTSKSMLIDVILYLSYNNRRITVFLNSGIDETLISQRFAKENRLQAAPTGRMGIAVDGHQITIYKTHNLKIKVKNNYNITRSTKPTFYVTDMTHYNIILGLA
jgi:hypothetical protein